MQDKLVINLIETTSVLHLHSAFAFATLTFFLLHQIMSDVLTGNQKLQLLGILISDSCKHSNSNKIL